MHYVDETGAQKRPIMLHRALMGSLERFIGTLIEHYAGNFPLWLAPNQVVIIPIRPEQEAFAQEVRNRLTEEGYRVIVDDRNESLSKRIREGSVKKIQYQIVIGEKEVASSQVAVRLHAGGDLGSISIDQLLERMRKQMIDKT